MPYYLEYNKMPRYVNRNPDVTVSQESLLGGIVLTAAAMTAIYGVASGVRSVIANVKLRKLADPSIISFANRTTDKLYDYCELIEKKYILVTTHTDGEVRHVHTSYASPKRAITLPVSCEQYLGHRIPDGMHAHLNKLVIDPVSKIREDVKHTMIKLAKNPGDERLHREIVQAIARVGGIKANGLNLDVSGQSIDSTYVRNTDRKTSNYPGPNGLELYNLADAGFKLIEELVIYGGMPFNEISQSVTTWPQAVTDMIKDTLEAIMTLLDVSLEND